MLFFNCVLFTYIIMKVMFVSKSAKNTVFYLIRMFMWPLSVSAFHGSIVHLKRNISSTVLNVSIHNMLLNVQQEKMPPKSIYVFFFLSYLPILFFNHALQLVWRIIATILRSSLSRFLVKIVYERNVRNGDKRIQGLIWV